MENKEETENKVQNPKELLNYMLSDYLANDPLHRKDNKVSEVEMRFGNRNKSISKIDTPFFLKKIQEQILTEQLLIWKILMLYYYDCKESKIDDINCNVDTDVDTIPKEKLDAINNES